MRSAFRGAVTWGQRFFVAPVKLKRNQILRTQGLKRTSTASSLHTTSIFHILRHSNGLRRFTATALSKYRSMPTDTQIPSDLRG